MTERAPVIGPGNGLLPRGQLYLTAPAQVAYAASNTYEKIAGTWAGNELFMFETNANGTLTYKGPDNTACLFTGSSDLRASKITTLTYGLFKNGELVPLAETPIGVQVPGRVRNVSITAIVTLNSGDYLEVFSKCPDDTVTLTAETLSITCWGDHR